jgi:hypothetical protein
MIPQFWSEIWSKNHVGELEILFESVSFWIFVFSPKINRWKASYSSSLASSLWVCSNWHWFTSIPLLLTSSLWSRDSSFQWWIRAGIAEVTVQWWWFRRISENFFRICWIRWILMQLSANLRLFDSFLMKIVVEWCNWWRILCESVWIVLLRNG